LTGSHEDKKKHPVTQMVKGSENVELREE
jgi:hypothetical protein